MPPSKSDPLFHVLDKEQLLALDEFIADQSAPLNRGEALRLILEDWLIGHGYLPPA